MRILRAVYCKRAYHRACAFQVKSGELEIQGGIYDLGSGRVQLLGLGLSLLWEHEVPGTDIDSCEQSPLAL